MGLEGKLIRLLILALFVGGARSSQGASSTYFCSYPAYAGKAPVLVRVVIEGASAKVDEELYTVIQDTPMGAVLVRSFASYNSYTKNDDLGLFGIVINKKTLHFTRGNILDAEASNSIATGSCKKG